MTAMLGLVPTCARRGHLEAPQVDSFASQPDMRDGVVFGTRLDGEEIGARARAQVSQATAIA